MALAFQWLSDYITHITSFKGLNVVQSKMLYYLSHLQVNNSTFRHLKVVNVSKYSLSVLCYFTKSLYALKKSFLLR